MLLYISIIHKLNFICSRSLIEVQSLGHNSFIYFHLRKKENKFDALRTGGRQYSKTNIWFIESLLAKRPKRRIATIVVEITVSSHTSTYYGRAHIHVERNCWVNVKHITILFLIVLQVKISSA